MTYALVAIQGTAHSDSSPYPYAVCICVLYVDFTCMHTMSVQIKNGKHTLILYYTIVSVSTF